MRWLALLLAFFAFAPTAIAQDEPVDEPDVVEEDPIDDEEPIDGDDAYTGCDVEGAEGDYTYCDEGAGGGIPTSGGPPVPRGEPVALPASTLPLTGGSPAVIALFGLSLLLIGLGGRRLSAAAGPRSPRGPS